MADRQLDKQSGKQAVNSAETLRSWMWVPADSERKIDRARSSAADAVILDLEDGTAPQFKEKGRGIALAELQKGGFAGQCWVRMNSPLDGEGWHSDLGAVLPGKPGGLVLPKVSDPEVVRAVHAEINALASQLKVPAPPLALIVTENATGVLRMRETLAAVPNIVAAFWGAEDLSSDLGSRSNRDDDGEFLDVFRVARSMFLLESVHAGLPAIDTPYIGIKDLDGLRRESRYTARMGFSGKQLIHPDHIAIINEAFSPGPTEVEAAERMVAAFAASGGGAVLVDGKMADPPHLKRAQKILARAQRIKQGETR